MSAAKTLTRPVLTASLLAGLVLPAHAESLPVPHGLAKVDRLPDAHVTVNFSDAPVARIVHLRRQASSWRYRVKRGDCLWTISRAFLSHGRRWRLIYRLNHDQIRNPNLIYPGQLLRMPRRPYAIESRRERHLRRHMAHRTLHTMHVPAIAPHSHPQLLPQKTQAPPKRLKAAEAPLTSGISSLAPAAKPDLNPLKRLARAQAPKTYQGHRRINGSFYTYRHSQMVWADDGTPVNPQVPEPAIVSPAPLYVDHSSLTSDQAPSPAPVQEPMIQGHRRINGSFFIRSGNLLLWADTLTPVRDQMPKEVLVAP